MRVVTYEPSDGATEDNLCFHVRVKCFREISRPSRCRTSPAPPDDRPNASSHETRSFLIVPNPMPIVDEPQTVVEQTACAEENAHELGRSRRPENDATPSAPPGGSVRREAATVFYASEDFADDHAV